MLTHLSPEPVQPVRVVVVGAGGFIGNAIAARLDADSVPVLRLARRDIDLLSPTAADDLAERLRPGDVFIAVAAMAPCRNAAMLRDNVALAWAMASAASRVAVAQVVNISSDAIYADSSAPLTETSIAAPDTLHGIMHLAREAIFRSEVSAPLAVLRPTLIYGAGDPHNGYGPNRFRRLAAKGDPIVLFGKGEERRDHVLIDDVAELAARVIYHRSTGALNVATGHVASFRKIAESVVGLSGRAVPIRETVRVGQVPHNGYRPFDNAACRAAFPDFAFTALAEGLAQAQAGEPAGS